MPHYSFNMDGIYNTRSIFHRLITKCSSALVWYAPKSPHSRNHYRTLPFPKRLNNSPLLFLASFHSEPILGLSESGRSPVATSSGTGVLFRHLVVRVSHQNWSPPNKLKGQQKDNPKYVPKPPTHKEGRKVKVDKWIMLGGVGMRPWPGVALVLLIIVYPRALLFIISPHTGPSPIPNSHAMSHAKVPLWLFTSPPPSLRWAYPLEQLDRPPYIQRRKYMIQIPH